MHLFEVLVVVLHWVNTRNLNFLAINIIGVRRLYSVRVAIRSLVPKQNKIIGLYDNGTVVTICCKGSNIP